LNPGPKTHFLAWGFSLGTTSRTTVFFRAQPGDILPHRHGPTGFFVVGWTGFESNLARRARQTRSWRDEPPGGETPGLAKRPV
jgi:hypothetical protein